MSSRSIIGRTIINLFEKVVYEFGGLDQGEVYLQLETGDFLSFPYLLNYEKFVVEEADIADATSIYADFSKNINWKIKDLIEIDDDFFLPHIELESGQILTQVLVSPNGTGHAGLRFFQNLDDFESLNGKNYTRLSNSCA